MGLIDNLCSVGSIRQAIVRFWYPYLTRRLRGENVVFLNYGFETEPPMAVPLSAADEPDRACIQLYHHVATQADLRGKQVLEISCGHGGGASYVTRTLNPERYTGLDLNPTGVRYCQQRHPVAGLSFVAGNATQLPFSESTFDAVINVEASHCYPDFPRFLAEVSRVLRPGGHFLYTDFRSREELGPWDRDLASAPLKLRSSRVINPEVRRGMDRNAPRSRDLVARRLPAPLRGLGGDFAGLPGSPIYESIRLENVSYRSYCFQKPGESAN